LEQVFAFVLFKNTFISFLLGIDIKQKKSAFKRPSLFDPIFLFKYHKKPLKAIYYSPFTTTVLVVSPIIVGSIKLAGDFSFPVKTIL